MTIQQRLEKMNGLLDGDEVAEILGIHEVTLRKWVAKGKIPCIRIGSRVKFDPGALAVWLHKRTLAA